MRYQFTRTLTVEGIHFEAGDVVPESAIPAGSLASLRRLGQVVPVREQAPAPRPSTAPVTMPSLPIVPYVPPAKRGRRWARWLRWLLRRHK